MFDGKGIESFENYNTLIFEPRYNEMKSSQSSFEEKLEPMTTSSSNEIGDFHKGQNDKLKLLVGSRFSESGASLEHCK